MERKIKTFHEYSQKVESSAVNTEAAEVLSGEPLSKKIKAEAKRSIGTKLKYLNKFSNNVESCTYLGMANGKLRCSIVKGRKQRFIFIDENHVVNNE